MHEQNTNMEKMHYRKLAIMTVLSFISIYILMYSMVNPFDNVFNNFNQVYMASIMTTPMVIIEILLMSSMYTNRRLNLIIIVISLIVLLLFFFFIRQQAAIGDTQFLRSMIPHHSGAILMCEQASIQDPEIQTLCTSIIESQQEEINQMEARLQRLEQ